MAFRLIIFLILNFTTLGIGRYLGGKGPRSQWYLGLETAPWTPSGLIVGLSWTITIICFSIYLAYLWPSIANKKMLVGVLILYYILILAWNPIFFYNQQILIGLLVITGLTIVVGFLLFFYWSDLKYKSLLVAPYFIWLAIATSLNAYILLKN